MRNTLCVFLLAAGVAGQAEEVRKEQRPIVVRYDAEAIRLHEYLLSSLLSSQAVRSLGDESIVGAKIGPLPGDPVEQPEGVFVGVLEVHVKTAPERGAGETIQKVAKLLETQLGQRLAGGVRDRLEEEVARAAANVDRMTQRVQDQREKNGAASVSQARLERYEAELAAARASIKSHELRIRSEQAGLDSLKDQIAASEAKHERYRAMQQTLLAELNDQRARIAQVGAKLDAAKSLQERDALRETLEGYQANLSRYQAKVDDVTARLEASAVLLQSLANEMAKSRVNLTRSKTDFETSAETAAQTQKAFQKARDLYDRSLVRAQELDVHQQRLMAARARLAASEAALNRFSPVSVEIW